MRGRHWVWLGLLILGGAGLLGYRAATHSLGITTGTSHNEAFYRFTASYIVDKTEAVSMDVVVACNVEITGYKFGGASVKTDRTPTHFPIVTRNRHVVLVQIPNACDWGMRDKELSQEVFPAVQFIESADNLLFGVGYLTEDAYASPLSHLIFAGARIGTANRQEWVTWRQNAAREFVPTASMPEPWGYDARELNRKMGSDEWLISHGCWAMARFKIPDKLRGWVRTLWPERRPKYWHISARSGLREQVDQRLFLDGSLLYNGSPRMSYFFHSHGSDYARGLRRGRSLSTSKSVSDSADAVPELYPEMRSNSMDKWKTGGLGKSFATIWRLDYDEARRGFAYCYDNGSPLGHEAYLKDLASKPVKIIINDDPIDVDRVDKFGTYGLTDATDLVRSGAWAIFERDEYFFVANPFNF